jgi:hypothetical protein
MTLRVPFDGFVEAVRRNLSTHDVYVHSDRARVVVSAGQGDKQMVVISSASMTIEEAKKRLHGEGLHVFDGLWSIGDDFELMDMPYLGAVSYRANKERTGVWLEAYPELPTETRVLQDLYEEFRETGELGELTFDQFEAGAQATVVVLSPDEIDTFLTNKRLKEI